MASITTRSLGEKRETHCPPAAERGTDPHPWVMELSYVFQYSLDSP